LSSRSNSEYSIASIREPCSSFLSSDHATYGNVLSDEHFASAETHVRALFKDIAEQYQQHHGDGTWIFGDDVGPTLLDAYTVTLATRLVNMERADLVPPELQQYAQVVREGPEWESVMHGRSTVYTRALGPVHLIEPL
jgi:hypothetical protein